MKENDFTVTNGAVLLASHLVVTVSGLAAGVVLGGWLAFETGYWRGFRAWVESMADTAALLAVALLLVAGAVSVATTYRRVAASSRAGG
jgi:hypothetical protein